MGDVFVRDGSQLLFTFKVNSVELGMIYEEVRDILWKKSLIKAFELYMPFGQIHFN